MKHEHTGYQQLAREVRFVGHHEVSGRMENLHLPAVEFDDGGIAGGVI
jgi:hypothetical protein